MRRKRLIKRLILGVVLALIVGALTTAWLVLRTPSWFRPPRIAAEDRQRVRDDLGDSAQAFSDALMSEGEFTVNLRQKQLNNWISMRKEIYPLIEREMPPDWSDPMILFYEDRIRLAARYRGGRMDAIVSLDLAVSMEPDAICLKAVGVRVGSVPLPQSALDRLRTADIDLAPGKAWRGSPHITGNVRDGLRINTLAVWPNGDRAYNVKSARVVRGAIQFVIQALGPARQTGRRSQR